MPDVCRVALCGFPRHVAQSWRLLCCCILLTLSGMAAAVPPKSFHFEHLDVRQGLSQESVFAILQDRQGFIWFGTQAGLNRYDGYRVTVYKSDPTDPHSLADNWIGSLHEDEQGRLWVGTRGGLHRFDRMTESFTRYVPDQKNVVGVAYRDIAAITGDGRGGLWLATGDGLQHLDPASGQFTFFRHDAADPDSLAHNTVSALKRDARGALWIGTPGGVDRLEPDAKSFRHYLPQGRGGADGKPAAVLALLNDRKDTLWVGTAAGLEAWTFGGGAPRQRRFGLDEGLPPGQVNVVYEDRDGGIWAGTETDGLQRWDAGLGRFTGYRNLSKDINSLASNRVVSLLQDRSGTLWIGTWFGGASRTDLASGGFERAMTGEQVYRIAGDGKGTLWTATFGGGVNRLDLATGRSTLVTVAPVKGNGTGGDKVTALLHDARGRLWAGTTADLYRFDAAGGRFSRVPLPGNPAFNQIRRIASDRAGTLWLGSRSGVLHYDPASGALQVFRNDPADPHSLGSNWSEAILEDRNGTLWIGTVNGLDRLDRASGRFTHFRHDPLDPASLTHDRVHVLFEDSKGRLWIGTAGGLSRMEAGADGSPRFRSYSSKDGLAADPIGGILEDRHGQLWISTTAGISRFDPVSKKFKNYVARDGMMSGSYFVGSYYRDGDDNLYFGGVDGLTMFKPAAVHDNPNPPPAAITDFLIFNRSIRGRALPADVGLTAAVSEAGAITLPHRDSMFAVEFAGLHFADPQRNRYAYKLDGFDRDWVTTGADKRFATYTNLDPGDYLFHVRTANKDGVWNDAGASLAITITPPFWMTWWFRLALSALLIGAAYGVYRTRILQLGRRQALLSRQVAQRTAEVVEQKEEIERQKESVERAHRNISLLSDIGREITATLDHESIMLTLYRHVAELMPADITEVAFYRPQQQVLTSLFAIERGRRSLPYTRSMQDPNQLAVWCVTQRKSVFINDLDAEYGSYIDRGGMDAASPIRFEDGSLGNRPQSLIYEPIVVQQRLIGVVGVHSFRKHAYQQVHLDMLRTLVAYGAVAFDNANAYRKLKDAQQQLVFQEKMASLGTLTAGVAHEINNPANFSHVGAQVLSGELEKFRSFLLGLAGDDAEPEVAAGINARIDGLVEQAGTIIEGTTRIKGLVQDLRTFSRLDQSDKKAVPIADSLMSTVNLVRAQYAESAAIRCDLEANPVLDCWPAQLNQVFMNLIVNACQAIQERQAAGDAKPGHLDIRTRIDDDCLLIEFEDDGCGIPADVIDRIFEPFFTTKTVGEGTGLGLSISFGIVEKHGGDIMVVSTAGKGSCFTVMLPLASQHRQAQER
jgi:ligand-binding sensor domain-containing protein/signal transduction histidine kinase